MQRIGLIFLLKIELPAQDVLLCSGGFMVFDGDTYLAQDPLFGTISEALDLQEGAGDEVPAYEITFLPPATAALADLSAPGHQKSRVRLWLAEYDIAAGTVTGTPDVLFDGQIDQTAITVGRDRRELAVTVVSRTERLFARNKGNALSPSSHKSVWPGETGHDNASGLAVPVAWGADNPLTAGNQLIGPSWALRYADGGGNGSSLGSSFREVML